VSAILPTVSNDPAVRYRERIVPLPVDLATIPQELLDMYRHWVGTYFAYMDGTTDLKMWVPVGRVGPLLVLGHSAPDNPDECPIPSFPLWAFGLAKISRETHEHLAEQVSSRVFGDDSSSYTDAPGGYTQTPPVETTNKKWVVEKLAEFPGVQNDLETVRAVLDTTYANDELFLRSLPPGWREAVLAISEGYPVADLRGFLPEPDIASMLPEKFGREHELVPLSLVENTLYVASPTPPRGGSKASNILAAWKSERDNEKFGSVKLSLVLCSSGSRAELEQRMVTRVPKAARPAPAHGQAAPKQSAASHQTATGFVLTKKEHDKSLANPSIDEQKFIGTAVYKAVVIGASDLHIEIFQGRGCLRIRKDGEMRLLDDGKFAIHRLPSIVQLIRNAIGVTGGSQEAYDGKFGIKVDGRFYDVRASIIPTPDAQESNHAYIVLRFLPQDGKVRSLHDLKLGKEDLEVVLATLQKPHGLVLMTGPTGSGKTTTLNAMIQLLNGPRNLKILTIEDPIEYTMDGVQQIKVTEGFTFAMALRNFLRQDPDVILVGEIRDLETARAAIESSQTGHLVFSTLHTNGAIETIQRLRGMGIPNYDLASSLLTLISQRLVRHLCPICRKQRPPNDRETSVFVAAGVPAPVRLHEPCEEGCNHCDKGWEGRIPVLEVVRVTPTLQLAIKEGSSEDALRTICEKEGSRELFAASLLKAATGDTSFTEACQLNAGWGDEVA